MKKGKKGGKEERKGKSKMNRDFVTCASFWEEWSTCCNTPVPFSNRVGQLIKIMCEKIGTLEEKAREPRNN